MATINGKKVKLFTLSANPELAEEISKETGIELSSVEVTRFADGELNINIVGSVRGCDIFIVQPTCPPANLHYMELFIMVDALKRASANEITVFMPYYGYSRQDRKAKGRQPITAKLIADMLEVSGVDRVVCIDLHAGQIQGFYNIPIDNFTAIPLLCKYFKDNKIDKNMVVVSPDHGGTNRARDFARNLRGAPLAIIDKRRPRANVAEAQHIIGDVKGKNCIIVDDIIDTGGTLVAAADGLKKAGAKDIYVAVTHAVLSEPANERLTKCKNIKKVIVTNTIPLKSGASKKIVQVSIGRLLGRALINIVNDEGISEIFTEIGD